MNIGKYYSTSVKDRREKAKIIALIFLLTIAFSEYIAQSTINKGGLEYVITTGVPFLRIATDARSSGMAEVGVSTPADNNSGFHNPSKLSFMESDHGASINFAPWLRQITNDIYLINANGYTKLNPNHAVGLNFRYFTLGQIQYKNDQGGDIGQSKPFEFALEGNYAFRLAENFGIGATGRFILSDLSNGSTATNLQLPSGTAFSVDFSSFYKKRLEIQSFQESSLNFGLNISNIGTKIQYSADGRPDYIPTNFSFGTTFEAKLDDYNSFNATIQFDKLLVPTPSYTTDNQGKKVFVDENRNSIADFKEFGSIDGMLVSFGDHGDGIGGELGEIIYHLGAEYAYQKTYFLRAGFYYEPVAAGGRQFATAGLGLKFNKLFLDFSYLLPITQQRSPLDNQMRVSVGINVGESKSNQYW